MKNTKEYKKYLCFILIFIMMTKGVWLLEKQADSFLVSEKKVTSSTIESVCVQTVYLHAFLGEGQKNFQHTLEQCKEKTEVQSQVGHHRSSAVSDLQEWMYVSSGYSLQKMDTRLCQPNELASVFTVAYIHQQDGLKRCNLS